MHCLIVGDTVPEGDNVCISYYLNRVSFFGGVSSFRGQDPFVPTFYIPVMQGNLHDEASGFNGRTDCEDECTCIRKGAFTYHEPGYSVHDSLFCMCQEPEMV